MNTPILAAEIARAPRARRELDRTMASRAAASASLASLLQSQLPAFGGCSFGAGPRTRA